MDHEKVNMHNLSISCGVMGLSRIGDEIEDVTYAIASRLYHPSRGEPCAFFIWSDLSFEKTNSSKLAEFLRKNKFGFVMKSSDAENPRTGNIITVYIWEIDHISLKLWYKIKRQEKLGKVGT